MRMIFAALAALALAACGEADLAGGPDARNPAGGYTLEVRATRGQGVSSPPLTAAPSQANADGVSALMDLEAARGFTAMPETAAPPEVLSLRVPGFELSIGAEGDSSTTEGARVAINAGGRQVHVNAREDGDGGNENAHVRITGASETDVRDFITKADDLSPAIQAEMLAALGLD